MLSTAQVAFTYARNRRRARWAAIAAFIVVGFTLIGQKWGLPAPAGWFVDAPTDYWHKIVPLAQFIVVSSLAYLALEIFHTSGTVERFIYDFFGREAPSRLPRVAALEPFAKSSVEALGSPPENVTLETQETDLDSDEMAQVVASPHDLLVLIKLHNLCYLRYRWTREGKLVRDALNSAIDHEHEDAGCLIWFSAAPGQRFLRPFHSGADLIWPFFGLFLAFWVHMMAWAEKVFDLEVLAPLATVPGQVALPVVMVFCGLALPIFYSITGRDLLNSIMDLEDSARAAMVEMEAKIKITLAHTLDEATDFLDAWLEKGVAPSTSPPAAPDPTDPDAPGATVMTETQSKAEQPKAEAKRAPTPKPKKPPPRRVPKPRPAS